jgi:hypothetical protein
MLSVVTFLLVGLGFVKEITIDLLSLMISTLTFFGYILFNSRMKPSRSSRNLNPWWKITTITRSNLSRLIMEIDTLVMAFIHFSHLMAFFGRSQSLSKMKWCIEEVEPFWK